jgi:hypothetical protein
MKNLKTIVDNYNVFQGGGSRGGGEHGALPPKKLEILDPPLAI